MSRTYYILLATCGSALLLGGAFVFQMLGYAPCKMCLWQRWPHAAAIAIGMIALTLVPNRVMLALGALAAFITAGIGLYHSGVERDWWEGPTSCTGGGLGGLGGDDLLSLEAPGIIMCDEVAWQFLTLSMASWNAVFSLALAATWLLAARKP